MTKRRSDTTSKRIRTMKNARPAKQAALAKFAARDLGEDIRAAGAVVVRPQQPTSILLSADLKEKLRRRGKELGVGSQTAAKMILARYVNAKL